ncbi:MAG: penicillin-binding protein 2 [Candidatus Doudnabacteria bacterium]|nr:penicillin-binding protein 2 [Candidatus Doudnabacteria bacterium]
MVSKKNKSLNLERSSLLAAFFVFGFLAIIARLAQLQIVNGNENRQKAENQRSMVLRLLPSRGQISIIDRSTQQLLPVATNIQKPLVYTVPGEIQNPNLVAASLSGVLRLPEEDLLPKLVNKDKKYIILKKQLTEEDQEKIRTLNLSGIYFDNEGARYYPQGQLLAHVLGFVGYKGDLRQGIYGLEGYEEEALAGKEGVVKQEGDISGAWIFGGKRQTEPVKDGDSLILTIDKNIQYKAEEILADAVVKHGATGGSVIVADPKTGKILAMASYPTFDPNQFNKVVDPAAFNNETVTGVYEPGSIFKPLTLAAALNEGKIKADTTYVDEGQIKIDDKVIKNSDPKPRGVQTMTQVLEQSLNTGVIFAKDQIGDDIFLRYLKDFGFGEKTGIELPEKKGSLDNLKFKIKINYATASFGQGISVTPIQMIQAFTAIANGGKMLKPYIVASKIDPFGNRQDTKVSILKDIISAQTSNTVTAMMVNVVENGHGKRAGVPGYYIAGKTGTAQISKQNGLGYEEHATIGSFIGFGPVEDPKFLMLVRIDEPKTVQYAESTAAPAFGEIAKFILNYYQVAPTR